MKTNSRVKVIATVGIGMFFSIVEGQVIPNYNFETWSNGANMAPDGWEDHGSNHPGFYPASQTNDKYLGNFAVKLENKITSTDTTQGRISTMRPGGKEGFGPAFPISVRYNNLKGFYKYIPLNGDSAEIIAYITKTGYVNTGGWGNLLGWGQKRLGASATYAPFSVGYLDSLPNIFYDSPTVSPDSAYIDIAAYISIGYTPGNEPQPKGNSILYIDALNFDTYLSGINGKFNITADFILYPSINAGVFDVSFETKISDYTTIKIYDLNGREVAEMFNSKLGSGEHNFHFNMQHLQNGSYIFVVATGTGYRAEKLIIQTK